MGGGDTVKEINHDLGISPSINIYQTDTKGNLVITKRVNDSGERSLETPIIVRKNVTEPVKHFSGSDKSRGR